MSKKRISPPAKSTKLSRRIQRVRGQKVDQFPTDTRVLFEFLVLVVDIRYRNKYKKSFDYNNSKEYSEGETNEQAANTT